MSRYINPYTDFGFKKLFGEEANKDLLIDFLNAVLPPENHVADLTFRNSEQLPDNIVDRRAIFDIACVGDSGESFTVEMQKAKQLYFRDRALFYAAFPIQRQAQKGDWNFKLNPVILVAVLDFEYDEHEERRKLYRLVTLKDQDGGVFSDTLKMVFLQMPLLDFDRSLPQTRRDKWLYFLKNLESFDGIPAVLSEPVFEKAFGTAEYVKFSQEVQEVYQNDLKIYRDNRNVVETARIEGKAEGLAEGEAKGKAEGKLEGKAEGLAEGKARGKAEATLEIVRKMKSLGIDAATIAQTTGLSASEIEQQN
ncbi:MAG: Rpn family recombination-promoting nuclease/putative transposase [Planctomycetaceae bacterium]|jgi:predicted transposase/invertase (TIGR01784 family)|nr:Rpn family recombination-promoting nuclease/putative transposase [Planctomycetaceae bacterium]